jgi:hypothetical protein
MTLGSQREGLRLPKAERDFFLPEASRSTFRQKGAQFPRSTHPTPNSTNPSFFFLRTHCPSPQSSCPLSPRIPRGPSSPCPSVVVASPILPAAVGSAQPRGRHTSAAASPPPTPRRNSSTLFIATAALRSTCGIPERLSSSRYGSLVSTETASPVISTSCS